MNRLLDKTILALCGLALMAQGTVGSAEVGWLCVAAALACLGEVVPDRVRMVFSIALLTCGSFVPAARFYAALAVYDAARGVSSAPRWATPRWATPAAQALCAVLVIACMRGLAGATLAFEALSCVLALLLSARSSQMEGMAARNRAMRDALQERALGLEAKNRDLIDRQGYEVELATLAERARIAREIHDNVGHLLTRATLQVEALRVVHANEPRVQADFADVGRTLADALDTVRASVHALREDAVDLSVQMRKVAADVAEDTPLEVTLDVECERVPSNVSTCLLAVAREALSNVLRHSEARDVQVRCIEHPGFYQLSVVDEGPAKKPVSLAGAAAPRAAGPFAGGGMGLDSMRERVEGLGGVFSAGPVAGGGWRVFASVPKAARKTASYQVERDVK